MKTSIWVLPILTGLVAIAKIMALYDGEITQRTPVSAALDVAGDICMLVWVYILLSS